MTRLLPLALALLLLALIVARRHKPLDARFRNFPEGLLVEPWW